MTLPAHRNRIAVLSRELQYLHELLIRVVVARAGSQSGTAELLRRERELEARRSVLESELEGLRGGTSDGGDELGWQG